MNNQEYLDLKCIIRGQHSFEFYKELKNNYIKSKMSEWYELWQTFECSTCGYITEPKYKRKEGYYSTPKKYTLFTHTPKKSE